MRIWYQSSAPIGIEPIWQPYEEALKKHTAGVARPDTKVDIHGVRISHPLLEQSNYIKYLHKAQIIDNAIKAENEGYDVFCVACTMDVGFHEIREVASIPAVFLSHTCFHLASLLADKFSLLANSKTSQSELTEKARQYGLREKLVSSSYFSLNLKEIVQGFDDMEQRNHIVDITRKAGKEAVKLGANLLIPSCNMLNMVLVEAGFQEIEGVPILDTAGTMVKMSELMVDLVRSGILKANKPAERLLSKKETENIRALFRSI